MHTTNHTEIAQMPPQQARIKVKRFEGSLYDHTTATVTWFNPETSKLEKMEFRPYPDSHQLAVQRQKDMADQSIDGSEAALQPGKAISDMQMDPSDWGEMFNGAIRFVRQAFYSELTLLKKEEEMIDVVNHDALERTTLTFPCDRLAALQAYHDSLEENNVRYSVVDGGKENRKHCGTVTQDVLDIALEGTQESDIVRRTQLEKWTSTNPSKVFERAKEANYFQTTGLSPKTSSATTPPGDLKMIGQVLPSPLRRVWSAASFKPTQPKRALASPRPSVALPQAPRRFGLFSRIQLPAQHRPTSLKCAYDRNAPNV